MDLSIAQQQHLVEIVRAFHAKIRSLVGSFKQETVQTIKAFDEKQEETIRAKIRASHQG